MTDHRLGSHMSYVCSICAIWFCLFPLPLRVWDGLRLVIVAFSGLFSCLFFYTILIDHKFGSHTTWHTDWSQARMSYIIPHWLIKSSAVIHHTITYHKLGSHRHTVLTDHKLGGHPPYHIDWSQAQKSYVIPYWLIKSSTLHWPFEPIRPSLTGRAIFALT